MTLARSALLSFAVFLSLPPAFAQETPASPPAAGQQDQEQKRREARATLRESADEAWREATKLWDDLVQRTEALAEVPEAEKEARQAELDSAKEKAVEKARELKALVEALEKDGQELAPDYRSLLIKVLGKEEGERKEQEKTAQQLAEAAQGKSLGDLQKDFTILEAKYRSAIETEKSKGEAVGKAADDAAKTKAAGELDKAKAERAKIAQELKAIIAALGAKGDKDDRYEEARSLMLEHEGFTDPTDVGAMVRFANRMVEDGWTWLVENGPGFLFQVIKFFLYLLVFRLIAGLLGRITRRALSSGKVQLSKLLKDFTVNTVRNVTMLIGLMVAVTSLGVNVTPLIAGITAAGLVIGLALQGTLSNFASGIMLLVYRPYDVGDVVIAGGVNGTVSSMNLVSTTILTFDNQKIIVPNNSIWGGVITNMTALDKRRVDLTFGVGYADDIPFVEKVLHEVVTGHDSVLESPAPTIKLHRLGESSVDFVVRPWVRTADYWEVYWDLTRAVKLRFDSEGITIPFPQRDVHVHAAEAAEPVIEVPRPPLVAGARAKDAPRPKAVASNVGEVDDGDDVGESES